MKSYQYRPRLAATTLSKTRSYRALDTESAMQSFPDVSPIFIVGAPRSGTTLLQLVLNAHPDVAIHGEIHFFDQVLQLKSEIPDLDTAGRLDNFFGQLHRPSAFRHLPDIESRLEIVRTRLGRCENASYELFYRILIDEFAERNGASRGGEKTPQNIRYLSELLQVFPSAKVVHIVRDPRAVVSSLRRMPWAPDSIALNALKWKVDMLFMRDFMNSGGTVHTLKYEDLVSEPEPNLRTLSDFLGVGWDPAMLEFSETADSNVRDEPWKDGTRRQINRDAVSGWRDSLTSADIALVQMIAEPFLSHFGYQPESMGTATKLKLPWQLTRDMAAYAYARLATREDGAEDTQADIIHGEETRLKAKFAEAVLTWRLQ